MRVTTFIYRLNLVIEKLFNAQYILGGVMFRKSDSNVDQKMDMLLLAGHPFVKTVLTLRKDV